MFVNKGSTNSKRPTSCQNCAAVGNNSIVTNYSSTPSSKHYVGISLF
jgi:hypothetical protein